MVRVPLFAASLTGALVIALAACSREATPGTTVVTSAEVQPSRAPASLRLATEVCKRTASCRESAEAGSSWSAQAADDCMDRERGRADAFLAEWDCSPAAASARLEECLASMKTANCGPLLTGTDRLEMCAPNAACGRHLADVSRRP